MAERRQTSFRERIRRALSNDVGIDLGTVNTLVYVKGRGVVISEPSVVAINQKTGAVVAVGRDAKDMLGRTPTHITAVKPVVEGVISDFEVTEEMISYLLSRAQEGHKKILGPRVVVGVPSGITDVETRAVRDACQNAGASEVHIVEEPIAAAIGMRLPVKDPVGSMVIDIGGGTTDIAVISLSGIVRSKNIRIAGDAFDDNIVSYVRNEFKVLIGHKSAEEVKIAIGSVMQDDEGAEAVVRGRDLVTGLPREVAVTDADIREAIGASIGTIVEGAREVLETTPPEILSDVMHRGVNIAGGGALFRGLPELLEHELRIPIHVPPDPLLAVVRGCAAILDDIDYWQDILLVNEDEISPVS
ncbi:MAG TPA: rod shape-determining protein [Candidatus Paceibacterota bacterium]